MVGAARLACMLGCWLWIAAPAAAAELVLFEAVDCVWCEAWEEEIGAIYPKTPEAQVAPLRRVDIHGRRPVDLAAVRGVMFTPTFVLMEDGKEVGRIVGYGGEDFFWGLLGMEMNKLIGSPAALSRLSEPGPPPEAKQGELE